MITERIYLGTILFVWGIGILICLYQIARLSKKVKEIQHIVHLRTNQQQVNKQT